jgi:hypothetical protein
MRVVIASMLVFVVACDVAPPLEGPGYVEGVLTSEAAGPFTVSSTLLILKKDDPEAKPLFDKNMEAINTALPVSPGLVASSLGLILFGDGYRTLTVWESEDAVLEWVISDAHATAMSEMATHSDPSSKVVSWSMTRAELEAGPPSWEDAKARLDADGREVY